MENPNLLYVLSLNEVNKEIVSKVFMVNQLADIIRWNIVSVAPIIPSTESTVIETGGKSKDGKQIAGEQITFIVADNMEYATGNKIPLWTFGFLY